MSAHVKVWLHVRVWVWSCQDRACPGWGQGIDATPTHAEALAAAWAHIKEHS